VKEKEENEKTIAETDSEKIGILHDSNITVKTIIDNFHKIKERFDNCIDSNGFSMFFNTPIGKEFIGLKNRGIKLRFMIEITKDNISQCKDLLKIAELRHVGNIKGNFGIADRTYYWSLPIIKEGLLPLDLIWSNIKAFVDQQQFLFETLWNKATPAEQRIDEIKEGKEFDIEVLRHSDITLDIYLDIVQAALKEIFFIFPTPKAFIRQLKAIYLAKQVSKERGVKIRILTPINETVENWIIKLSKEEEEEENISADKKYDTDIFTYSDIKIRPIEKMSNTKATIVIVDKAESLVMELKDDTKDTFIEAIGLSTHSNSKARVLSYVAIFENLWKQSELYEEIKKSNENLVIANERLKINDKMQKEFINIAAHELRTPLQPILSLSQLLKDKIKDDKQKELLDIVIKNTKKLKILAEDILDVTKIESNTLYLNKEDLCLGHLLLSIIKEFEHGVGDNKEIKFEIQLKDRDSNLIVNVDRNRISQVISNLINNSIKFITNENGKEKKDGLISITVEKNKDNITADKVIVNIKDNGEGIDPEIFPKLFTKFASKSFQGTGLGLYISKNIVEAHGGMIWAENNKDGQGASFSFSLPFSKY
ncbi:MAG TPA: HAMP domain-containing sensor histidine kinase, partial [Candidatus Nitrosocosmicus sp.]